MDKFVAAFNGYTYLYGYICWHLATFMLYFEAHHS